MIRQNLIGKTLVNGFVIEKLRSSAALHPSGACHSIGFIAKAPDGRLAFVKVLDPTLDTAALDPLVDLKTRLDSFLYERDVVFKTRDRKLRSVVRALGEGTLDQNDTGVGNAATYLLFELATGDLREQVDLSRRFDLAYRLRVLHNTAKGLSQLHLSHIAHQDLKPSNVVTFDRTSRGEIDTTKIADLGHAHDRQAPRPGADRVIAGDPSYAPPEQLYNSCPSDWVARRFAADLYQLGGLSVFLMTGVGATELIGGHLRPEHHWDVWLGGSYADILPHLVEATDAVLEDLAQATDELVREEVVELTKMLLDPDPTRRAHPKNLDGAGAPYGLERFISRFNVLAEKAEWALGRAVSR